MHWVRMLDSHVQSLWSKAWKHVFGVRTCHELICMFLVYHSSKKSSVRKCIQAIYSLPVMCEGTGAGLKWFCSERRDGHASYNVETGPSDQLIHADQDTSSKLVPFGLYLPWLPIYVLIKSLLNAAIAPTSTTSCGSLFHIPHTLWMKTFSLMFLLILSPLTHWFPR